MANERWNLGDLPSSLRYRRPYPAPRDVEVFAEERHCERGCIHLAEAYRRGIEAGERAERERQESCAASIAFTAAWAFLAGVFAAAVLRLLVER